jgi:energy-coupling factor transporter ATP-binding protein EcfA2
MIIADPLFLESIAVLRRTVGTCGFFPGLVSVEHRIDVLLQQVEAGVSASARPFRIVLAGGTGVGKTTLLNALAQANIAPVGERRPTTKGFTIYLHASEHDPWAEELEHTKIVRHHRDPLRGKTIIDSPDADSSLHEHRRMLEEMIAVADLVLLVATQEKYVSASLLNLVRTYRRGRSFAFVFNKTDLCESKDVVDDYKGVLKTLGFPGYRIYAISAKQIAEVSSTGHDSPQEEFAALEGFIACELDQTRIREIESRNIAERVEEVSIVVRSALPETWETAGEAWRQHCVKVFSQFFAEIGTMIRRLVLQRETLADTITTARGSALAGLFGFASEILYAFRRFRTNGSHLVQLDDTENWVRGKTGLQLSEAVARREAFAQEACCSDGIGFGLDTRSLREALAGALEDDPIPRGWCEELVASHLQTELRRSSGPPGWWANILVNIVPWAWMIYWAYRLIEPTVFGRPAPWESIPGAALVFLALVIFQWSVVHRLLRWNATKRADAVVSAVLSAVEAAFLRRRLPTITRIAEKVISCTRELEDCLALLERVTQAVKGDAAHRRLASPVASDSPDLDIPSHGFSGGDNAQ